MTTFKKTLLAATIAGVGMAGTQNAMADAYAAAYQNVWNFSVLEFAGNVTNIDQATNSKAGATLNGNSDQETDDRDAPVVNMGTAARANNAFFTGSGTYPSLLGKVGQYSVGDAGIPLLPNNGEAANYAEGFVTAGGNTADAFGTNELNSNITVEDGTQLRFEFQGLPYLIAEITGDMGDKATANVDFSLTLRRDGQTVFGWSPNGEVDDGSISGTIAGTEQRDDYDLNTDISAFMGVVFDEFAPGGPIAGPPPTAGLFRATTNALSAGTYTLNVSMNENVDIKTERVPAPASLALLSLGLVGIGAARRRNRNA